ncbi:TMV resistance protein N-like [Cornus florida]|uniref:TMV resistance protein N-like n=1 Tax=Cornus florida TaxID=4283 RepID=UPI0028A11D6F|nr:TMV resistance protein N-like [Cornus florida]
MASTSTHTVSSSSTSTPKWNYEVFLSFKVEDTRKNFVDHLFTALSQRGIYTFKDDKQPKRGKDISPLLLKAIEESRFALIVFSKNYASSKWCLDEVVKIMECKKTMGQTVVPVFYDVDPSEVRKQTGSFASAFEIHEKAFSGNMEKVQRWKTALVEAANLCGYSVPDTANGHESKGIVQIVEEIFNKLNNTSPLVAQDLVGTESRVEKMESLLCEGSDEVRFIGIWGMGGIGKTTIVKAVYDRNYHQFEGSCFLANVRDVSERQGLEALQKQLLSEILTGSDINIPDTVRGANIIMSRLRFKRVLVVLDDVDKREQLDAVAEKHGWFGTGSRIIVTTRDKHLLTSHGVNECHSVEALNEDEATQLLSLKAFKQSFPSEGYLEISKQIVDYAGGLPLALTILGSFLHGRTTDEWKSTLIKLHKIPNKEILQVLKISFDELDEMEKEIFLDIACFFKGNHECYVTRILDSCGFCPGIGIPVLVEKSLLTIANNHFCMHDLIQEMGWYIVRQESQECRKRSRLWLREDVCSVLKENAGTGKVEGIGLELPELEVVDLNYEAFAKMKKLRVFKVHNVVFSKGPSHLPNELRLLDWHAYPSAYLPASFQAENLVELSMCYSSIKQLWKKIKPMPKLKVINLSYSHRLSRTPDFTVIPNLETLILEDCTSLVEVHPSIGVLKRLVYLSLKDCKNLRRFPNGIHLESLETFILSGCLKLEKCPEILGDMVCLSELNLDRTSIKELPSSIEHLTSLTLMDLSECKYLTSLPRTICRLSCLKTLSLCGCSKLEELPDDLGNIKCLEELHANKTAIRRLPSSINLLEDLKVLSLSGCKRTISVSFFSSWFLPRKCEDSLCLVLPSLTGLNSLTKLDLSDCSLSQGGIPSDLGSLSSLKVLNLSRNNFVSLPATISGLSQLEFLDLVGCKRLKALPKLPSYISCLYADDCHSLTSVGDLSTTNKSLRRVTFTNCLKLLENKWSENVMEVLLRFVLNSEFIIILPGREIPEWFSHQKLGTSTYLQRPPDWDIGIVLCAVCEYCISNLYIQLCCHFLDHDNNPCAPGLSWSYLYIHGTKVDSQHMILSYIPTLFSSSEVRNSNKWRQVEVYFEFVDPKNRSWRLPVTKWGVHLVKKDGCGNLGFIDGSDEAAKRNTLKRKRDDYDRVEAKGNGSAASDDESPPAKRESAF